MSLILAPSPAAKANMIRGLALIAGHGTASYYSGNDIYGEEVGKYRASHDKHPFGLNVPPHTFDPEEPSTHIIYLSASATDITVELFLLHIRHHCGYTENEKIHYLRVISQTLEGGGNYVFFEFWSGDHVVISGYTTTDSGAGNEARRDLEDIFAVLSTINGIEIVREPIPHPLSLHQLQQMERGTE